MSYALIIFENPSSDKQSKWQPWQNILNNLEHASKDNVNIQKIHENAWLFALQNVLLIFAQCLSDSSSKEINFHVCFLDEKPLFIPPN